MFFNDDEINKLVSEYDALPLATDANSTYEENYAAIAAYSARANQAMKIAALAYKFGFHNTNMIWRKQALKNTRQIEARIVQLKFALKF